MPEQPEIPRWVPLTASIAITRLWAKFSDRESRERLSRLASYPVMRTHVWALLSQMGDGLEGKVIEFAFTYSRPDVIASALVRNPFAVGGGPPNSAYGPPVGLGFAQMVDLAETLHAMMILSQSNVGSLWPKEWQECHGLTYDQVTEVLEAIADFFFDQDSDWSEWRKTLPIIRKRGAANAAQNVFAPMIDIALTEIYGSPSPVIVVNTLTEVVFDLQEGLAEDTTRSRLRAYAQRSETS